MFDEFEKLESINLRKKVILFVPNKKDNHPGSGIPYAQRTGVCAGTHQGRVIYVRDRTEEKKQVELLYLSGKVF